MSSTPQPKRVVWFLAIPWWVLFCILPFLLCWWMLKYTFLGAVLLINLVLVAMGKPTILPNLMNMNKENN
jgi:hypothetical protein